MYLLGFEAACKPTERGSMRSLEVISMRQEIIDFAMSLFPNSGGTLEALECLQFAVGLTIDDILFSMEEAEEFAMEEDPCTWYDAHAELDYDYDPIFTY
jgi:hypothetical protein